MIYNREEEDSFKKTTKLFENISSKKQSIPSIGKLEFTKKNRNGVVFGVIKEQGHYTIKVNCKQNQNLADFEYIDGYESRKKFQRNTLQESIKQVFLLLNEDKYVVDVPVVREPAPEIPQVPAGNSFEDAGDMGINNDNPSGDGELEGDVATDAPAGTDVEKEMQQMTGKLAQDFREEIASDNEDFTVGMFKSIIAAAKNLSPENKQKVMSKATEVLSPEEEQPVDGEQSDMPIDNSGSANDEGEQMPPVQESLTELSKVENLPLDSLKDINNEVNNLAKNKYIYDDDLNSENLTLYFKPFSSKDAVIVVKFRVSENGKDFYLSVREDGEIVYGNRYKKDDVTKAILNKMVKYFENSTKKERIGRSKRSSSELPNTVFDELKAIFVKNPLISGVSGGANQTSMVLRLISNKNKKTDAFIFYDLDDIVESNNYDFYVVPKEKVPIFVKNITNPIKKNPKNKEGFYHYDYDYLDKTKEETIKNVNEWLKDLLKESESLTLGEFKKLLNEGNLYV